MRTPDDACDYNDSGYPDVSGPVTRPRARLEMAPGAGIGGHLQIDQRTDLSSNKALPWAWTAALFGGLGFGGLIVLCLLRPWEADDRAAQAELRAEFAQRIERTEALAGLARKEASTAKDMVDIEKAKTAAYEQLRQEMKNGRR